MILNGMRIEFSYTNSFGGRRAADLLIVATKNQHLEQAMHDMQLMSVRHRPSFPCSTA
jgi:hypothetical protein